jgi:hypothetical protein
MHVENFVLAEKYVCSNNALTAASNSPVCGHNHNEGYKMHFLRQIVHSLSRLSSSTCGKVRNHALVLNTILDLSHPRSGLVLENALLQGNWPSGEYAQSPSRVKTFEGQLGRT